MSFSAAASGPVDLTALGDRGFRIDGADKYTGSGRAVAAAGDVNRDGYDDVLIGSPGSVNNNRVGSGSAYVVFGGEDTSTVDLANLGDRGFRIDGAPESTSIGGFLAGAGDVNGDGYDDVLLGSRSTLSEPAYVVFGGSQTTTVDLNTLGARGFRISGSMSSMDRAGDINDDGYDDLIFGDPYARPASSNYRRNSGSSYVVFGGPTTDVDLADLGDRGFRIDGTPDIQFGDWVAGAGDVNGDRVDDLLIGAPAWTPSPSWGGPPPSSYVIFGGNTDALNLKNLGDRGVKIAGSPVAAPGDVDGDGVNDLLIRTVSADDDRLVFGGVSDLGDRKVRLDGTGWSAAGGDVNGDGRDDLLIPLGGVRTKRVYVAFGGPPTYVDGRGAQEGEEDPPHRPHEVGAQDHRRGRPGSLGRGHRGAEEGPQDREGQADQAPRGRAHHGDAEEVAEEDTGHGAGRLARHRPPHHDLGAHLAGAVGGVMSNQRRPTIHLLACGIAAGLAGGLLGAPPSFADRPDVGLHDGFLIRVGASVGGTTEELPVVYSGAGDVNGDGYDDLLVGAPVADNGAGVLSGSAYVVFGGGVGPVDLTALGDRGFRIDGADKYTSSGRAVAAAGDVNRDGYGDVLIGSPGSVNNNRVGSGSAYVVFGGEDTSTVGLANLGDRGFRIDGATESTNIGGFLAGAGDVNGDGYDDVLLGARSTLPEPAYVVFGGSHTTTVDLNALGARGFRISGDHVEHGRRRGRQRRRLRRPDLRGSVCPQ